MRRSSKVTGVLVVLLFCILIAVWYAVFLEDRRGHLKISFLDVGQGDAIYIDTPSGRQVLIDGGPGSGVLRQLSNVMPWYDRTIDLVVATHPDQDHIGGLIDVLPRYKIGAIIQSSVLGSTAAWETLQRQIREEGAEILEANRGHIIELGKNAHLEILFPDRAVPNIETNVGCVVTRLVYGETSFMLPCDSTAAIETYLVRLDGENLKSNVLKAAHHGSKTSSAPLFVGFVDPQYAVFSRGCDNSYGHPSPEVVERFTQFGIPTLDTCVEGAITFVSDGQTVWKR